MDVRLFKFESVLNQDSILKSITILGKIPSPKAGIESIPAILILQKSAFDEIKADCISAQLDKIDIIEHNDIYQWMLGWLRTDATNSSPDVKINLIAPATEVHIKKYSAQLRRMVRETPELYSQVTRRYIDAFPPSRTQWVYNILNHVTEADSILFEDPSPTLGFVLLPDLKWDRKSVRALYLMAIAHSSDIKSMRDLRKQHLPMLNSIRNEATKVAKLNWGLEQGTLRFYVHYQPSYYQFHVHVVTVEMAGFPGMSVGQAHLLDDIISLLELDPDEGPSIFERMTLTYVLGERHGLYQPMKNYGALT